MRARARIVALLLVFGPALAQEPLTEIVLCPGTPQERAYDASNPWAWPVLGKSLQERIVAGDFTGAYEEVLRRLSSSPRQLDATLRDRFLAAARASEARNGTSCDDLRIVKPAFGAEGPSTIFPGASAVALDAECGDRLAVDQGDELRYAANALENICTAAGDPARRATLQRIVLVEDEFDRYLFHGFPMYPWEAAINSWTLSRDEIERGPPGNQLVLLHPIPAVTVGTDTFRAAEPDLALGVDLVGWVHYLARSAHSRWWGVTAMAGIANDRGTGLGVGLVWGPMRAGAVWYDDDASGKLGDDRTSVLLGLDLYQFLGEKYRTYRMYRTKIRNELYGPQP